MDFVGLGDGGKGLPAGRATTAKPCDTCKYAAAMLFCRADSLFLCMGCDSNHGRRRHERVWLCEVCEQAPASVTCKADAAALCVTCDRDIHSANPLARRHDRVPVVPFYDSASAVKSSAAFLIPGDDDDNGSISINLLGDDSHGEVPASWIEYPNSGVAKLLAETPEMKSIDLFLSYSDQFIDFDFPNIPMIMNAQNSGTTDSVVPVQTVKVSPAVNDSMDNHFQMDFTKSNFNSYSSNSFSQNRSVSISSSSMDVGVVPDGSSMSERSCPLPPSMSHNVDKSGSGSTTALQLSGMDRVARVLRYREKRKNRKFEKRIRYASRKAYAETRPRIKGRFAKRTDVESKVDNFFNSGPSDFLVDSEYGVVPSFLC